MPTVFLLGAGFLVVFACRYTQISPIVGFIIAGIALGPAGLSVVEDNETTSLLAKMGVVFLLFDIGLQFPTKSIWKARRDFLGFAPLQVLLCGIVLGSALMYFFGTTGEIALIAGLALALSSTAVVMQILQDMKETEAPVGKSAKAVLIFQDIVAIFLLIFADAMGSGVPLYSLVLDAFVKTMLAVAAVMAFGRFVLTPLMKNITRFDDPEMFTIFGLLIVMLTALGTELAGLSLTLGAFLAGMVLAETPYRMMLQTELRPFRSLLLAFFFITVGMQLDAITLIAEFETIAALTALLIVTKLAVFVGLLMAFKLPSGRIIQMSALMSQGSEFALVVFGIAAVYEGLGLLLTQELVAACALSMLITPFMTTGARWWSYKVSQKVQDGALTNCPTGADNPVDKSPVVIVGMNEVGKTLARALREHDIPYIAVDHDRQRFLEATTSGYVVAYGDPSDIRFWRQIGMSDVRAMCLASPRYEVAKSLAPLAKKLYPNLKRYAAVEDSAEGVRFAAHGLIPFQNRGTPPGLGMAAFILRELGVEEEAIGAWSSEEQEAYLDSLSEADGSKSPDTEAA